MKHQARGSPIIFEAGSADRDDAPFDVRRVRDVPIADPCLLDARGEVEVLIEGCYLGPPYTGFRPKLSS